MRGKKGLSTVVTTLIIVLLVLVAIGIIWAVIRGVIEGGTGQIDTRSKCIEVDVRAITGTDCTSATSCTVVLRRSAGGEAIGGVKLVFYDTAMNTSSNVIDVLGNIQPLDSKNTGVLTIAGMTTIPNKVAVTPYFTDVATGEEQLCTTSSEFSFT